MCTCFTWRKEQILVAMNFDNNTPFSVSSKDSKQFLIMVNGSPCFGVNHKGLFINHLMVDSNGKGAYKRGKNVVHTIKLITDVLGGTLGSEQFPDYFREKEIVNVPNHSCHSMLTDGSGDVWIVEPGNDVLFSGAEESSYFIMSNFSLNEWKETGKMEGSGTDRYQHVNTLLHDTEQLDVQGAFKVLESVKQTEGEWKTAFSMVYSHKENAVYYCYHGEYGKIQKFELSSFETE